MQKRHFDLDSLIFILARKLQYFKKIKSEFVEFEKYHEVIEDTIANMDYTVFMTSDEIKNNKVSKDGSINLDSTEIRNNFKKTLKDRNPIIYWSLFR